MQVKNPRKNSILNNVKEVFTQVGYIDSANASKKFKSIYNTTPSAYRAKMHKKPEEDSGNG